MSILKIRKSNVNFTVFSTFIFIFLLFVCTNTQVLAKYPEQPISLVVPFSAGGTHDMTARLIVSVMPQYIENNPMVVELRPGAGGAVGAKYVASSKPDGYTLLLGGQGPNSALPLIEDVGYGREDFTTIARINKTDKLILAVHPESPFETLDQLVEFGQENPNELVYGSSGMWGQVHIPTLTFLHEYGIEAIHVPYDGGGPLALAAMGGEVDFSFGSATRRLDNVLAGKLRALAIIGDERLDQLPEVKSTTELGYEFPYYPGYRTIFAPAGTPQEIVDYLREATANLVEDPSFISMIRRTGATVDYMDGPEFEKIWDEEIKNLKVLVEEVVEE